VFASGYPLRFCARLFLLGLPLLTQAGLAQCSSSPSHAENGVSDTIPSTTPDGQKETQEDIPPVFVTSIHAVQLEVKLKKSGAVLEAKFLLGPAELRKAAIKAVKARNYKRYVTTGSSNRLRKNGTPRLRLSPDSVSL
jgi:hypothetical protein